MKDDVNQIIDNRLGESNTHSSRGASERSTASVSSRGEGSVGMENRKGCTFKSFLSCRPTEYLGSVEPKVTMRLVRETEQVMEVSKCLKGDKVYYASRLLKDDTLVWWNTLYEGLGKDVVYKWPWTEFFSRLKNKFCPTRDIEKLEEDFLTLKKGSLSMDEYTKKFCDMLPFVGESYFSARSRVNRYAQGLPWEYELEVKRAETLDDAIIAARNVEDKKGKFQPTQSKQGSRKKCEKCGKEHEGDCQSGAGACYNCGRFGHKKKDCKVKHISEVECYSCHEKGHFSTNCPKKGGETLMSTAQKKPESQKVKSRAFQITREEAKETHDVVSSILFVNSLPTYVLFDSVATHSFVSHEFGVKLKVPLELLDVVYEVEVADGKHIQVQHMYRNCELSIDNKKFQVNLLPIRIKSFDIVIGMDWLGVNDAKIECGQKRVSVKTPKGKVYVYGERGNQKDL
ncbi:hypothetical protein L2E82_30706 [Cichorium intybus]|uniref:Uncharacterized protein n=1 Tax=Cichorium intybus TaxID=13427 RepID=A0ACB9D166_CICIN|nr:hypothetical protein L2E82_30706 [Cichorium intybus]